MMRSLLPLLALLFFTMAGQAQQIFDSISKQVCACVEKEHPREMEGTHGCFNEAFNDQLEPLLAHYGVKTAEEVNFDDMHMQIYARLLKQCEYFFLLSISNGSEHTKRRFQTDPDLKCPKIEQGKYYYVQQATDSSPMDTTWVSIANGQYLEKFSGGPWFSRLDIQWKGACAFDLIFRESDHPFKKHLSKPGEVYSYTIVQNTPTSMVLKIVIHGRDLFIEFFKE